MADPIAVEALIRNPALNAFVPFVGTWATIGQHPMLPGTTLHGRASFGWHEGEAFMLMRTDMQEPDIPSGIAIFGSDDEAGTLSMQYFDERTVSRRYEVTLEAGVLRWWRNTPSFSQRYAVTIAGDERTMQGVGEMSRDGGPWSGDLSLTYTRVG